MKWSSGSISRPTFLLAVLTLGVFTGGCASHKTAPLPPPLRGSVNLDLLVRRHPGWGGIGQYDAALRRLEQAYRTLPALPLGSVSGLPRPNASGISAQLDTTQQALLDGLRARREMARRDEVEGNRDAWSREGRLRFPSPILSVSGVPDLELQLLEANVTMLTRTVNNWKPSPPPAPRLEAVKDLLAQNKARLQALLASREGDRAAAEARFMEERQHQRESGAAYAQAQADALEGRLKGDDERLIAAQSSRLSSQRAALLAALGRPAVLAVPTAGYAGAETLPHGPSVAQASLSAQSLASSEARLRAQRVRWIKFLYDDTQAAALDVAGQRRWDVTFGRPRPGDRDLTAALAQAMAGSVWRLSPRTDGT